MMATELNYSDCGNPTKHAHTGN